MTNRFCLLSSKQLSVTVRSTHELFVVKSLPRLVDCWGAFELEKKTVFRDSQPMEVTAGGIFNDDVRGIFSDFDA